MTKFYGSVDGTVDSRSEIVINHAEEIVSESTSMNVNVQAESSKEKSGKSWKIGTAVFICAAVALARSNHLTGNNPANNTENTPLFSESRVADKPMVTLKRPDEIALIRDHTAAPPPFSTLDPVADLGIYDYDHRPDSSSPGKVFGELYKGQKYTGLPLPTNKWYENMVLVKDENDPTDEQRVYTVPYLINTIGPVPGIKLHGTRVLGMANIVQVVFIDQHGMTLGAAKSLGKTDLTDQGDDMGVQRRYKVDYVEGEHPEGSIGANGPLTPLGLTLKWEAPEDDDVSSFTKMTSSIVRGMPYGTMHYHYVNGDFGTTLPTVVSQIGLAGVPLADSGVGLTCASDSEGSEEGTETLVNKSIEVHFWQSDFSWLVFYSEPVYVRCYQTSQGDTPFVLQVTRLADTRSKENEEVVLTSRVALMNNCTTGGSSLHCDHRKPTNATDFSNLLKDHADVYPGKHTKIDYTFFSDEKDDGGEFDGGEYSYLQFDWDARSTIDRKPAEDKGLLMHSLPHHREMMMAQTSSKNKFKFNDDKMFCSPSLNGDSCIVEGSEWVLQEDLNGQPSFWAPRPPMASAIPSLAKAIMQDIKFRVPDYFAKGAGDTYFSGKILAKLARILLVYKEVDDICSNPSEYGSEYTEQCKTASLPSEVQFNEALDHLRSATEIWINGTAETPFVYDSKWAGMVSCGCLFDEKTQGCRNKFPDCPSFSDPGLDFGHGFYNDHHFHQGYHIYAASAVAYFDEQWGKDQFENVLLLIRDIANPSPDDNFFPMYRQKDWYLGNSWAGGIAMAYANGRNQESSSESIAAYEAVSLFGSVMAGAWARDEGEGGPAKAARSRHIRDVGRLLTATEVRSADRYWHVRQEGPKAGIYPGYQEYAIGMMWNMMAQFQTWFGAAPYLAIGIQLMPLTPVSESRDDIDWAKQLYPSFAESCHTAKDCDEEGWGVLLYAILAEVGHPEKAIAYAESLSLDVFETAGGNGHSLTNTIWYYSTRPKTEPLELFSFAPTQSPIILAQKIRSPVDASLCPPCGSDICSGDDNKCPVNAAPYLCTEGPALGGCSMDPWEHQTDICHKCCLLSVECQQS